MADFKLQKTGVSSAIKLEVYKGVYSLSSGWIDKEGNFKLNWGEFERYNKETKTKETKKLPLKITLGSRERAIEILDALKAELAGQGGGEDINF